MTNKDYNLRDYLSYLDREIFYPAVEWVNSCQLDLSHYGLPWLKLNAIKGPHIACASCILKACLLCLLPFNKTFLAAFLMIAIYFLDLLSESTEFASPWIPTEDLFQTRLILSMVDVAYVFSVVVIILLKCALESSTYNFLTIFSLLLFVSCNFLVHYCLHESRSAILYDGSPNFYHWRLEEFKEFERLYPNAADKNILAVGYLKLYRLLWHYYCKFVTKLYYRLSDINDLPPPLDELPFKPCFHWFNEFGPGNLVMYIAMLTALNLWTFDLSHFFNTFSKITLVLFNVPFGYAIARVLPLHLYLDPQKVRIFLSWLATLLILEGGNNLMFALGWFLFSYANHELLLV